MPCPLRDDVVLVPDAFAALLIHPTPAAEAEHNAPVPQRKVVYRGRLVKPVGTICMTFFRITELIVLFKENNQFPALKTLAVFVFNCMLLHGDYIEIIKNRRGSHAKFRVLSKK